LMRPRMKNIRILPELVAANQPVEIEYRLQNISSRYCWDLHVDTIPIRGMNQSEPEHLTVKCIPPQQTIQLHRKITFSSRGRHELPLLRVASSLPFGLTMCGTTSVDCQDILVYPDYTPLEHIDFPLGKEKAQDYTLLASLQQQDVFEFHACREYRYGDDRRHIHALSWARLGFPVVKEFNEEYKPHACVMIDPSFPQLNKAHDLRSFLRPFLPGSHPTGAEIADALASILCSACDKLLQDGYQMDLFDLSSPSQNLPTLLGPRDLSEVFKVAASLQLQPEFIPPTHAQLQRIVTIQNLLVITASFSQHHVDILNHLQENFVRIKILWVSDDPPPTQLQRVSEEAVQLLPRQILAGQVTSC
ncbi:MAG: DUF58 domain-containing protein, partial [Lentisphaerae bacterium]